MIPAGLNPGPIDRAAGELYSWMRGTGEIVTMARAARNHASVISALRVRAHFGEVLRRVEKEHRSLVIEKRGVPRAVILSLQEYVRIAAPEPEVLRLIGEESKRKGTDALTSRQIDRVIRAARGRKTKR